MSIRELNPEEKRVIIDKGTERPFSGKFENFNKEGTYVCRQCGTPLYSSNSKFHSGCGWPSFDEELKDSVKRVPDKDGRRVEIQCAACGGHLGHVFEGEGFTEKNTRHCVNSISLDFTKESEPLEEKKEIAILGGGCFWCLEAVFGQLKGVIKVESGYAGGHLPDPNYKDVCAGNTGHAEVIKIEFDPGIISYYLLLKIFFSVHDPTTLNMQGNDVGEQYRSIIFYNSPKQEQTAKMVIKEVNDSGLFKSPIVTELQPFDTFYKAELYHQEYFFNNPFQPYCQAIVSPKVQKFRKKFENYLK